MGREYTTRRRLTPSSYDVLLDSIDVHILLNKLELLGVKKSNKTSKWDLYILCPFHGERTPSCRIYTAQKSFSCYGCGTRGNILDLCKDVKQISYLETIRFLCTLFDVKGLEYETEKIDLSTILDGFQERIYTLLDTKKQHTQARLEQIFAYLDFFEEQQSDGASRMILQQIREDISQKGFTSEGIHADGEKFLKTLWDVPYEDTTISWVDIIGLYIRIRKSKHIHELAGKVHFPYLRNMFVHNASSYIENNSDSLISCFESTRSLEKIIAYCLDREYGEEYEQWRKSVHDKSLDQILYQDNN